MMGNTAGWICAIGMNCGNLYWVGQMNLSTKFAGFGFKMVRSMTVSGLRWEVEGN